MIDSLGFVFYLHYLPLLNGAPLLKVQLFIFSHLLRSSLRIPEYYQTHLLIKLQILIVHTKGNEHPDVLHLLLQLHQRVVIENTAPISELIRIKKVNYFDFSS
jgi:hypothetical protein